MTIIARVKVSGSALKYTGPESSEIYVYTGGAGAKRCGLTYNPTKDVDAALIKSLAAALMEALDSRAEEAKPDAKRCFETAMNHLEAAQMFAVKGLFQ